jgi:hypothetical protein
MYSLPDLAFILKIPELHDKCCQPKTQYTLGLSQCRAADETDEKYGTNQYRFEGQGMSSTDLCQSYQTHIYLDQQCKEKAKSG